MVYHRKKTLFRLPCKNITLASWQNLVSHFYLILQEKQKTVEDLNFCKFLIKFLRYNF